MVNAILLLDTTSNSNPFHREVTSDRIITLIRSPEPSFLTELRYAYNQQTMDSGRLLNRSAKRLQCNPQKWSNFFFFFLLPSHFYGHPASWKLIPTIIFADVCGRLTTALKLLYYVFETITFVTFSSFDDDHSSTSLSHEHLCLAAILIQTLMLMLLYVQPPRV